MLMKGAPKMLWHRRKKPSSSEKGQPQSLCRHKTFLILTGLCLVGLLGTLYVVYIGGNSPGLLAPGAVISIGFVYSWWLALGCREEVRALYESGVLSKTAPDIALVGALDTIFRTLHDALSACFVTMLVSLSCIVYLLKHCR